MFQLLGQLAFDLEKVISLRIFDILYPESQINSEWHQFIDLYTKEDIPWWELF